MILIRLKMILWIFLLAHLVNSTNVVADTIKNKVTHLLPGRSGIVHLFEWRFDDIAQECEQFLGPRGFGGIQVSPVNENIILDGRPWFERYQPLSYKMKTRSGNQSEFEAMVKRCNKAGVRVYVDVVVNHMAADNNNPVGTAGSVADPSHKSYPAAGYTRLDFHQTCSIDNYNNATNVRDCELVGLHDLDQSKENVRNRIITFFNKLISYGVAGLRVDAAKHMWPSDLRSIYGQLDDLNTDYFPEGSKPFVYQEVIYYGGEAIKGTDYIDIGLVTEFRFGKELSRAFRGNNPLHWLKTFGPSWSLMASCDSLVFIDNHDTQRSEADILTYKQAKWYKMAAAFMLAWPYGEPRIMSSFHFKDFNQGPPHNEDYTISHVQWNPDLTCANGWVCEHRWRQIFNMVRFRNNVQSTNVSNWWDNNNNQIAFSRGNLGFIAFNRDSYPLNTRLQTGLPEGKYCDIISGNLNEDNYCTGKFVIVDKNGFADIFIGDYEEDGVIAIDKSSKLKM